MLMLMLTMVMMIVADDGGDDDRDYTNQNLSDVRTGRALKGREYRTPRPFVICMCGSLRVCNFILTHC